MRWCLLGALAVGSAAQAGVPSGGAWIVGTENGDTMSLVGDPLAPRSPTAFDVVWGSFDDVPAGQEISLRLSNVLSDRFGSTPDTIGTIVSQIFTGSGAVNNTAFSGGSVAGSIQNMTVTLLLALGGAGLMLRRRGRRA